MRASATVWGLGLLVASIACGDGGGANPVGSEASGLPRLSLQTSAITISDLGSLGGNSWAYAINEVGQVVGGSGTVSARPVTDIGGFGFIFGGYCLECFDEDFPGAAGSEKPARAVLWQNGGITDLGTLGGLYNTALGINDLGQVVGTSGLSPFVGNAFLWQAGVMTDLGAIMDDPSDGGGYGRVLNSGAYDINNEGTVVGIYDTPLNASNGFVFYGPGFWSGWSNITSEVSQGNYGDAQAINESGQVVGGAEFQFTDTCSTGCPPHAYLTIGFLSRLTDLGTLPVPEFYPARSTATDINDIGQVVGGSDTESGSHAFLWENGTMIDLGTLGGNRSHANAINNKGQIVGWSTTADNLGPHAFLWEDGLMTDLGSLGGSYSGARDINEKGQIVGYSYLPGDAAVHATMWIIGSTVPVSPTSKQECKKGGWEAFGFRNQGQCVRLVETGKDSRNGQ